MYKRVSKNTRMFQDSPLDSSIVIEIGLALGQYL